MPNYTERDIIIDLIDSMFGGLEPKVPDDVVYNYLQNRIVYLDKKADKAKDYLKRERKSRGPDPVLDWIFDVLTTRFQYTSDIAAMVAVRHPEVSVNMVVNRLAALEKDGIVEKAFIYPPKKEGIKNRKVSSYRLIPLTR